MNRTELEQYISEAYDCEPDFPWAKYPDYQVFRHTSNKKWFALVMNIPKDKLGLTEGGRIDVVNFKCDPVLIGSLHGSPGIFPAYHMSKASWISVSLDGSAEDEKIKALLDLSFELTKTKPRRHKPQKDPE